MSRRERIARLSIAALTAAALAYPIAALAQPQRVPRNAGRPTTEHPAPRVVFGGGFQIMQPVGRFADSIDAGFGGGGNLRVNLDRQGIFSLRLGVGGQVYGNERQRIPFPTAPRVTLEQNTNNFVVSYNVGPQFTWPSGPVRPYVHGFVGGAYFATNTSLEGTNNDNDPFASSENYSDNNFSYGGGAGLLIPIRTRRTPVAIDLGARYQYNGTARYLKPGSIVDNGNSYTVNPIVGPANFMVYTIGVSIGAVDDDDDDDDDRRRRRRR